MMGSFHNLPDPLELVDYHLGGFLEGFERDSHVQAVPMWEEWNREATPASSLELAKTVSTIGNTSNSQLYTPPTSRSRSSSISGNQRPMDAESNCSTELNPPASELQNVADIQDTLPNQGSKLVCLVPGCKNTTGFSHQKELLRHSREHNPESPLWYCGCCRNMGITYKATHRKDKLKDHMKKVHRMPSSKSDFYNQECPQGSCSDRLLFTTDSCVSEHLRQEHSELSVTPAGISYISITKNPGADRYF